MTLRTSVRILARGVVWVGGVWAVEHQHDGAVEYSLPSPLRRALRSFVQTAERVSPWVLLDATHRCT